MGMGIVRRLVEKGWRVAIADIKDNKEFANELGSASSFHRCNVADYDRCVFSMVNVTRALIKRSQAEMFQQVWHLYGRIDALCANAGIVDRRFVHLAILCEDTN